MVEKSGVEKFMVEKCGVEAWVEKSRVEMYFNLSGSSVLLASRLAYTTDKH